MPLSVSSVVADMARHTCQGCGCTTVKMCVRCSVEDGRTTPATMSAQHPRAGNALAVCDRHGADLLLNGWTYRIPPGGGPMSERPGYDYRGRQIAPAIRADWRHDARPTNYDGGRSAILARRIIKLLDALDAAEARIATVRALDEPCGDCEPEPWCCEACRTCGRVWGEDY